MMTQKLTFIAPLFVGITMAGSALAQAGSGEAGAGVSLSGGGADATAAGAAEAPAADTAATAAATPAAPEDDYMSRYKPENNLFELGIFGGIFVPSKHHELAEPKNVLQPYAKVAPDFGLRLAYFPLGFLGVEAEGAIMPTHTRDDQGAALWSVRGHGILQLPLASVVPFVLMGGGALGTKSDALGQDTDPELHFGAGVKVPFCRFASARLDLRDTMSQKGNSTDGHQTHYPEALLGITFTLGRTPPAPPPPPPPPDSDKDGLIDDADQCPLEAGPAPTGCPPPPDTDGDGIVDKDDKCPKEAGPAPDGCPPPPDADKDGVPDKDDQCKDVPGPAPKGCPLDPDNDGIEGDADQCPDQPETKNGYLDTDGCPDELPAEVKKYTGVISGIEFDFGKATIRPKSNQVLDAAAKILTDYPDLKVEISGHTDNVGGHDPNVKLSQARADSVKAYLVSKGVDATRIQTRGAGPDEPLADNKTAANRQKNRRIEFKILM